MLIGRAGALAEVLDLVGGLADGRPRRTLVRGEAGIGKTAFLNEIGTSLARRGTCVAYGRGDDLDRGRPFRLVIDLATSIATTGSALEGSISDDLAEAIRVTTDADAGSAASQHVLGDAFVHVVEALAIAGPVVLLADDLQWADAESAVVLRRIGAELADLPVGLVGAARPGPLPPDLGLIFAPEVERPLGPLRAEDLEELAGATVGAAPGPLLVHELRRSGGNPFFALELIRGLRSTDRLVFGDGRVDLLEPALPEELRATVLDRVAEVDGSVADLLRIASVLGSAFQADELEGLADTRAAEGSLAEAVGLGLLDSDGAGGYSFRHDLVRAALYDALDPTEQARLHQRAVTVLSKQGAPSARLASHLVRSESHSDDATLDLLERVAWDLQRSSAARSVELAERGLSLVEPGSARSVRLLTGMVEPLLYLGRFADAERVARAALADGGPTLDRDVRLELWHDLYVSVVRQDAFARAMEDIDEFLRAPDLRAQDEALMRVCRGQGTLQQGRFDGTEADAEFAIAVGEDRGDDRLRMGGWLLLALTAAAQGRMARATECGQAQAHHHVDGAMYLADLWHAIVLIGADEMTVALQTLHHGRERARGRGDLSSQATYDWATAALHYTVGNFDDCLVEVETGRGRIRPGEGSPQQVLVGRSVAARVHLHRGDLDAARTEVERGDAELAAGAVLGADLFLWAKAMVVEHDGDPLGALDLLDLAYQVTAGVPYLLSWRPIYPELVRLALAAGRTDLVEHVLADADAGAAAGGDLASGRGCALMCRGLAEGDLDLLIRATAAYRRGPRLPDLARCAEATGTALAQAGRVEEAVQLLREAAGIRAEEGAVTELRRIEHLLRTLDLPSERAERRASDGWGSLTPSELRVAELVAEGLTTPAIAARLLVSPNTVSTHIRHIFGKLGVSSRSAVAAEAARRREPTAP